MGPLGALSRRMAAGVFGALALLSLFSAGVRLLPWVLDGRVSWATVGVFARGLCVLGLETACLFTLPLAWGLSAVVFADRGEVRACMLAGASPAALTWPTWPLAALLVGLSSAASLSWGREASAPGEQLSALLAGARGSCGAPARPVADVPGTGLSYLCAYGQAPRLAAAPSPALVLLAEEAEVSFDLREGRARGLTLSLRGPPALVLRAGEARLVGFSPFARAASLSPARRAASLGLSGLVGAFAVMSALLARLESRRLVGLGLGIASAAGPLALLSAIEAGRLPPGCALSLPLAALLPPLAYALVSSPRA